MKINEKIKYFFDKFSLIILIVITTITAFSIDLWSYRYNYINAYIDAKAHLVITRGVFDSIIPGVSQLGGVWLPLFHILMFPFITNNFLYQTGLAGTIVNSILYIISSIFLFKLLNLLLEEKLYALLGTLIFVFNPNILYMQSAAMTELSALTFIILSLYFFVKWQQTNKFEDIILLSVITFIGTIARYENWILSIGIFLGIIITSFRSKDFNNDRSRKLESNLFLYCYFAFLGIALWFLWNLVIFHDPLYFIHGIYSSYIQQIGSIKQGLNLPYLNPVQSLRYYLQAVADNCSWLLMILGTIGSIYILLKTKSRRIFALFVATIGLFFFECYSIYKGNTTIFVPELFPYGYSNIRYGLMTLPFLVIFTSFLFSIKNNVLNFIVVILVAIDIVYPLIYFKPVTLLEPLPQQLRNTQNGFEKFQIPSYISKIKKLYKGGYILMSEADSSDIQYELGIDLKNTITEGDQHYWLQSLKKPEKYASMIILDSSLSDQRNILAKNLLHNSRFYKYFVLAFKSGQVQVYVKKA